VLYLSWICPAVLVVLVRQLSFVLLTVLTLLSLLQSACHISFAATRQRVTQAPTTQWLRKSTTGTFSRKNFVHTWIARVVKRSCFMYSFFVGLVNLCTDLWNVMPTGQKQSRICTTKIFQQPTFPLTDAHRSFSMSTTNKQKRKFVHNKVNFQWKSPTDAHRS
jgi:hypothetical protein